MAGKNRANTLSAILSNMDDLKGAYEDALQAEGSALRENEAYLDSIQGRIDLFTNALQTMWMNFLDDDAVKFIVDLGTAAIKLVDTLGLIPTALGAFAGFKAIKSIIGGNNVFTDFIGLIWSTIKSGEILTATNQKLIATTLAESTATQLANSSLVQYAITSGLVTAEQVANMTITELLGAAFLGLAAKIKAAALALGQFLIATPVGWAILATTAIVALAGAFKLYDKFGPTHNHFVEHLEEQTTELKEVQSELEAVNSELEITKDRIEELEAKGALSFVEEQELTRLKAQSKELERQNKILEAREERGRKEQLETAMKAVQTDANLRKGTQNIGGYVAGENQTRAGLAYAASQQVPSNVVENTDDTNKFEDVLRSIELSKQNVTRIEEALLADPHNEQLLKELEAAEKQYNAANKAFDTLQAEWVTDYGDIGYIQDANTKLEKQWNEIYNQQQDYLDKQSLLNGEISKADVFDRVFGSTGTEVAQEFKAQFDKEVKSGKTPTAVISELLSDDVYKDNMQKIIDYFGITTDELTRYFTQIGEAAKAELNSVSTYSKLSESVTSYKDILTQTSEIVTDNIKVTQEYKDSLTTLGISESELNECFDENNKLIVKDASALNKLVKSAKSNTTQNIKLAKSQARLQYYEKYKEIRQLTKGKRIESAATLAQVKLLYQEMTALQKTIARYSMLEHQLLGATNAYEEFAKAQEIDGENDYETKAEELVGYLVDAFHTAKLGTESAQAAIKGLVPESVYADLDTLDEKMAAIYKYFTEDLSDYFYVKFNDDGSLESAEMLIDNVKKFVDNGIKKGVFTGSWEEWDLDSSIDSLDEFADKMDVTKEIAYAFFQAMETYDISWLGGDSSTLLDKLIPTTTEMDAFAQKMQKEFDQTPIDLTARVQVSAEKMKEAGYSEFEGEYATLYTHTFNASDFGLTDENGNDYAINVTPILPDGTVIQGGSNGLWEYINGKIQSGENLENLDIFLGSYKTVEEAEAAAQKLHEMQEDYYNMVKSYNLENAIYTTTQKQAALDMKLATGQASLSDEATLKEYNALNAEAERNAQLAYEQALGYQEASEAYNEAKEQAETLAEEMSKMQKATPEYAAKEKELKGYTDQMKEAYQTMVKLGEPTEVTLTVALDKAEKETNTFKKSLESDKALMSVFTRIEENGIESFGFEKDGNGAWTLESIMKAFPELDEQQAEYVRQFLGYVEAEHTIDMQLGQDTPTTEQTLQSIYDTLEDIALILSKAYGISLDTTDAETKVSGLKTHLQELAAWWDSLWSANPNGSSGPSTETGNQYAPGAPRVNGTAHVHGTAFASGNWGAPKSETALTGELGPELRVRGNRWDLLGENGAEFTDVRKGDIIFNHKVYLWYCLVISN